MRVLSIANAIAKLPATQITTMTTVCNNPVGSNLNKRGSFAFQKAIFYKPKDGLLQRIENQDVILAVEKPSIQKSNQVTVLGCSTPNRK